MNQSSSDPSDGSQSPTEITLQKAIQLYEAVRLKANARLSFAPLGDNGLADNSGAISSPLLSEMFDVLFQRIELVSRSLVEHSELPDQIYDLSLQESTEARLAATICTAYYAWMLSDMSELLKTGSIATVSPMIDDMIRHVALASTSPSTSLRKPGSSLRSPSVPLKSYPALEPQPLQKKRRGSKATKKSGSSSKKSPTTKKRPSAKKKKVKSRKRSAKKSAS